MHIRGKAGIGLGFHIDSGKPSGSGHHHIVIPLQHLHAHFAELCGDGFQVSWNDIGDLHASAGCGGGNHIGAGFDHIRNDGVSTAVQGFYTLDFDGIGPGTGNLCAAGVQKVCHIHDVWFSCRIFNDGHTRCANRCQHHIDGGTHRNKVEEDTASF